jgi:hypothetical protein
MIKHLIPEAVTKAVCLDALFVFFIAGCVLGILRAQYLLHKEIAAHPENKVTQLQHVLGWLLIGWTLFFGGILFYLMSGPQWYTPQ